MQQPPPMMSGSAMNGYATSPSMSSLANGYYPEAYANVMHNAYAPAPPPPPPAAPYGSLPSGGARMRTMSTASHSSIPPSTTDTATSEVERNSQPIASERCCLLSFAYLFIWGTMILELRGAAAGLWWTNVPLELSCRVIITAGTRGHSKLFFFH